MKTYPPPRCSLTPRAERIFEAIVRAFPGATVPSGVDAAVAAIVAQQIMEEMTRDSYCRPDDLNLESCEFCKGESTYYKAGWLLMHSVLH